MTPKLNISSDGSTLTIDVAPVFDALPNEHEKNVNRAKSIPRLEPLARHTTKLLKGLFGLFAVFFVLAGIGLAAALLFNTFQS
ncbi:MAG: hypothetical protein JO077_14510 [Verrucomicrobia bacterium]|nr:hypothetical protein [Verrucomicrobiota bacterium]MBV8588034.1 hypothetical protein [Verrucomicrobiota bacterium]